MRDALARPSHASLWGRAAVVAGLTGLAVAQPVLDLLGRNPQFFVAGRYSGWQIVAFGLLTIVAPPAGLVGGLAILTQLHRRAGSAAFVLIVAGLGAVFGNVLARGVGSDSLVAAVGAGAVGALAAVGLTFVRPGLLLLQYLAVANVLFLVGFLVMSPTSRLLDGAGGADLGHVEVPQPPGPVVVLIMDEFPVTTLMREDGTINAERFPAFAELASRATWFRNASSLQALTHLAIPTLLTGEVSVGSQLPSHRDHPRNLLSLLGAAMPVDRYELVTDLCPPAICDPPPAQSLVQAVRDASVVYGHRVLPRSLRDDLPEIDHSWGGFGDELGGEVVGGEVEPGLEGDPFSRWKSVGLEEKSAPRQAAVLVERATAIDGDVGVHLIHVALPHYPWILTPWGTRLMEFPKRVEDPADPGYDWSARLQFQLQSMQAGAADAALGQILEHFDQLGIWDDTTFVLVSDHGTSLLPPDFGRSPTERNLQELYRIPMFVHAPGQQEGEVDDAPALTVDLLPSLVDLLGIETDWEFDGHSLFDGSAATVEPKVGRSLEPALEVVGRHHADTPTGWDWTALAAVGEHRALVGRLLADIAVGAASGLRWAPDHAGDFAELPTAEGKTPQLLTGVVIGAARPPELVVAVNGTIGGTLGGYVADGGSWRFASLLGPYLVDGANDVRAYEVEETSVGTILHELG